MAERADVFQGSQIGVELIPGVQVPAIHRLLGVYLEAMPMEQITKHVGKGGLFATGFLRNKPHTQANISGTLSFPELPWLFSSVICQPVLTTPTSGVLTRQWAFRPTPYSPNTPNTFTLECGTPGTSLAERCVSLVIQSLTIRATQTDIGLTGTAFGKELQEAITMTSGTSVTLTNPVTAPTATAYSGSGNLLAGTYKISYALRNDAGGTTLPVPIVAAVTVSASGALVTGDLTPLPAGAVSVDWYLSGVLGSEPKQYVISSSGKPTLITNNVDPSAPLEPSANGTTTAVATIGDTPCDPTGISIYTGNSVATLGKNLRNLETEFSFTDHWDMVMAQDEAQSSFSAIVEKGPVCMSKITVEHDAQSQAFMAALKIKLEKFLRIVINGPIIEVVSGITYRHQLMITIPMKFANPGRSVNGAVYAATYDCESMYDSTYGTGLEVVVTTTTTALTP